jgi:hypothetical protein
MANRKKQVTESEDTFLSTAARAVGSTLGKIAAKTGLVHGAAPVAKKPARKPAAKAAPAKKKKAAVKKTASRLKKRT